MYKYILFFSADWCLIHLWIQYFALYMSSKMGETNDNRCQGCYIHLMHVWLQPRWRPVAHQYLIGTTDHRSVDIPMQNTVWDSFLHFSASFIKITLISQFKTPFITTYTLFQSLKGNFKKTKLNFSRKVSLYGRREAVIFLNKHFHRHDDMQERW